MDLVLWPFSMHLSEMALMKVVGMVRFSTEMALTAATTLTRGYFLLFRVMFVMRTPRGGTQQNMAAWPSLSTRWKGNISVLSVG